MIILFFSSHYISFFFFLFYLLPLSRNCKRGDKRIHSMFLFSEEIFNISQTNMMITITFIFLNSPYHLLKAILTSSIIWTRLFLLILLVTFKALMFSFWFLLHKLSLVAVPNPTSTPSYWIIYQLFFSWVCLVCFFQPFALLMCQISFMSFVITFISVLLLFITLNLFF